MTYAKIAKSWELPRKIEPYENLSLCISRTALYRLRTGLYFLKFDRLVILHT